MCNRVLFKKIKKCMATKLYMMISYRRSQQGLDKVGVPQMLFLYEEGDEREMFETRTKCHFISCRFSFVPVQGIT
jgi:hypothetical protein